MELSHGKQEPNSVYFLHLPFEIRHRIYQISFEPGLENGRGCANILCLNKFIFAEAQAYLHGPLYDCYLGRQVEKFCDMARRSTCLSSIDIYLHCIASNGLSDAVLKPRFTLPYTHMKKLIALVHLDAAIEIQAVPWDGTIGYDGRRVGTGLNETLTVEHFNEMKRQFVEQRRSEGADLPQPNRMCSYDRGSAAYTFCMTRPINCS